MAVEIDLVKIAGLPGQSTVTYAKWNQDRATNDDLLREFGDTPHNRATLLNAGILERHHPKGQSSYVEALDQIREGMIKAGVTVIKAALERSGKNGAELLYLASSSPPDREGIWGQEIARRCSIDEVRYSYLACNGAAGALLDVLNQPDLKRTSIVVAGDEAVGFFVRPGNLFETAIFDSGAAAFCFTPDTLTLINGQTVVTPDLDAVISVPNLYDLPKEGLLPPRWYVLEDGADNTFNYSQSGIYQSLPTSSDPNHIMMKGGETTRYFARTIPLVVTRVLSEYYQDHKQAINTWVSHQPSKGVIEVVQRKLNKLLEGTGVHVPQFPWVMDKAKMGNVSSATVLIALTELAGQIKRGEVFNITAYGIGSSVTSMNLLFK